MRASFLLLGVFLISVQSGAQKALPTMTTFSMVNACIAAFEENVSWDSNRDLEPLRWGRFKCSSSGQAVKSSHYVLVTNATGGYDLYLLQAGEGDQPIRAQHYSLTPEMNRLLGNDLGCGVGGGNRPLYLKVEDVNGKKTLVQYFGQQRGLSTQPIPGAKERSVTSKTFDSLRGPLSTAIQRNLDRINENAFTFKTTTGKDKIQKTCGDALARVRPAELGESGDTPPTN